MKRIAILGSTGSIGTQALEIIRNNPDKYKAVALSCGKNTALLQQHGAKVNFKSRPEWLDQLFGSSDARDTLAKSDLGTLFQSWIDGQDEYLKTRVNLY